MKKEIKESIRALEVEQELKDAMEHYLIGLLIKGRDEEGHSVADDLSDNCKPRELDLLGGIKQIP